MPGRTPSAEAWKRSMVSPAGRPCTAVAIWSPSTAPETAPNSTAGLTPCPYGAVVVVAVGPSTVRLDRIDRSELLMSKK